MHSCRSVAGSGVLDLYRFLHKHHHLRIEYPTCGGAGFALALETHEGATKTARDARKILLIVFGRLKSKSC
jgi:hypothetical protein